MKISTKLIAAVFGFAIVTALIGGTATFILVRRVLESSLSKEQLQVTTHRLDSIDRYLYERYLNVQNLSKSVEINNTLTAQTLDSPQIEEMLAEQAYSTGSWDLILVIDTDGKILSQSKEDASLSRLDDFQSGRATYRQALEGETVYSNLILANETGKPNIIFAAPVRSEDEIGKPIIGAVVGYLSWEPVLEFLETPESSKIYLLDESGKEIARDNMENVKDVLTNDYSQNAVFLDASDNESKSIKSSGFADNSSYLTSYAHEPGRFDYKGLGWTIFTQTPLSLIYRSTVNTLIIIVGSIIFLALLASAGFWLFIQRMIVSPVYRLIDYVSRVGQSDLNAVMNIKSSDELGQLSKTIQHMAAQIQASRQYLESQIKDRTLDLEKTKRELEERQEAILNVLEDARELESSLKEEKNRTELIVSSMGEGLLVVDKEFNIAAINPTAERLMAISQNSAIGQPWAKIITAYQGDTEIPFEQRTSVLVIKKGVTIPTRLEDNHYYLTKTGRKYPVVSVTSPITREGKIVGAVKVFRDATSEKESKAIIERTVQERTRELAKEQALSSSILEHAGEGIVLTNDAGLVTYINPAFTMMVGYKIEALRGKSFASEINAFDLKDELIPPSQRSDAAAVTAENQEVKMFLETATKEKRAVISNAAPIRVEGEFKGVVRILHDYNEDLTLQRQKDDFFSIASHELRTPLTVISGNLDTILAGYGQNQLGPEDTQLLKDSLEASERLIKIVEDFLNVSRLDQGRLTFSIRPVDYSKIFEDVVNELKSLADPKGVTLELFYSAKNAMVMADEGLLREIMTNLIGNSLKFTEKGSIKIESHIKGQILETTIADTGMGINPEMQGLLFQRFQQAMKRTLNRDAGGTGLGLYISREFARKMGGELWLVRSTPEQGSTFALSLPLAEGVDGY